MSRENVELFRRGYELVNEAYRSGDWRAVERHIERAYHPDVVMEAGESEGLFTEGVWTGREGLLNFIRGQTEALEGMWIEPEEYIDVSDELLVVPVTVGGRARHTGIPFEFSLVHLLTMRGGKAVRLQLFADRQRALSSAGLQ